MKKYIALIMCVFLVSGCAVWPFKYKVISTGIDIASTISTGKSSTEHAADLVTEMKEIKHPFQQGIKAKKGIDF